MINKLAIALLLSLSLGCNPGVFGPEIPPANTFTPTLAAVAGVVTTLSVTPAPAPEPAPGPRECGTCGGKGWNGDGTVRISCNTCGGDGILDGQYQSKPPEPPKAVEPSPVKQPSAALKSTDNPENVAQLKESLERIQEINRELKEQAAGPWKAKQVALPDSAPPLFTPDQNAHERYWATIDAALASKRKLFVVVHAPAPKRTLDHWRKQLADIEGYHENYVTFFLSMDETWADGRNVGEAWADYKLPEGVEKSDTLARWSIDPSGNSKPFYVTCPEQLEE